MSLYEFLGKVLLSCRGSLIMTDCENLFKPGSSMRGGFVVGSI